MRKTYQILNCLLIKMIFDRYHFKVTRIVHIIRRQEITGQIAWKITISPIFLSPKLIQVYQRYIQQNKTQ